MSDLDNQINNVARAERGENVTIPQNSPKTDLDKQIEKCTQCRKRRRTKLPF